MQDLKCTGIILCGGQSKRMGNPKVYATLKGKTFVEHLISALQPLCEELILSTNINVSFPKCLTVYDEIKNIGPIAGIFSSLKASHNDVNVIVSCDTPLLNTLFFNHLINHFDSCDILIAQHDNVTEPLIGIYRKSTVLPIITKHIEKGVFAPPKLFPELKFKTVQISKLNSFYNKLMFTNFNSQLEINSYENT